MTQEELAAELGVTAAAVSKWEKNYTMPDVMMLGALADFFQVSADELMGRREYLRKVIIAAEIKSWAVKIENLARQHGFITEAICETYQEAVRLVEETRDISYILLSMKEPVLELEHDKALAEKHYKVIESVCSSEEETMRMFEILFHGIKG